MAVTESHVVAYRGRVVLVVGAAGFIGRHAARLLEAAGAEVHAVVRPGSAGLVSGRRSATVAAELSHRGAITQIVGALRPAVTFNFAGYGVDPRERDAALATRINDDLVHELAQACGEHADRSWPGQQLVHVGSALEYGTAGGDLHEGTSPSPTTLYGQTKLAGAMALAAAVDAAMLRGTTARLFTVYGPGEHPGRLLPSLIAASRSRSPLALTLGAQLRDFTFVGDVAEGVLRLGCLTDANVGPVNVATGQLESVRRFTERAADVIGLPRDLLRFGEVAMRPEEMHHDNVNIARLVSLSGWTPLTTIEDGVRATLAAGPSGDPA